jgi:hypothetical protein
VDMESGLIYVLDTGNSRIKVLSLDLEFIRHIENDGLKGRSCTGMLIFDRSIACMGNVRSFSLIIFLLKPVFFGSRNLKIAFF